MRYTHLIMQAVHCEYSMVLLKDLPRNFFYLSDKDSEAGLPSLGVCSQRAHFTVKEWYPILIAN